MLEYEANQIAARAFHGKPEAAGFQVRAFRALGEAHVGIYDSSGLGVYVASGRDWSTALRRLKAACPGCGAKRRDGIHAGCPQCGRDMGTAFVAVAPALKAAALVRYRAALSAASHACP